MIFKALLVLTIALEFVFVPWFLKAVWPERTKKSLLLKMICSTLFIIAGLLAIKISGNTTLFALLIITGLAMGWVGDFFLHAGNKTIFFLIGLLSFMGGHISYIVAYSWAIGQYFPTVKFFSAIETAAFVCLFSAAAAVAAIKKMKLGAALIPVSVYTAILVLMFVKAGSLGIRMVFALLPGSVVVCVMLILGALCFVVSDALLAVIMFAGQMKNRRMKAVNIVTYFTAQILLACSIIVIS